MENPKPTPEHAMPFEIPRYIERVFPSDVETSLNELWGRDKKLLKVFHRKKSTKWGKDSKSKLSLEEKDPE